MFKPEELVFCGVLIGLVSFASCKPTQIQQLTHSFDKVNDILVKKFGDTLSVEEGKAVLHQKLVEEQERTALFKDKHLVEALENIVAFVHLKKPSMCTSDSLDLLRYCDEGTQGKARLGYNANNARLIEKMLFLSFVEHADTCKDVYINHFSEAWSNKKEVVDAIYPLLETIIDKRLNGVKPEEMKANEFYEQMIRPKELTQEEKLIVNSELIKRIKADTAGEGDKSRLSSFEFYIGRYCEGYRKELGSDLFAPAEFDAVITKPGPKTAAEDEYYKAFAGYNLCGQIEILQI